MKRYVSLAICAVLLIVAIVISAPEKVDVVFGKGSGQDTKVSTIEQFAEVLDFFNNYQLKASTEKSVRVMSEQDQEQNEDDSPLGNLDSDDVPASAYTSATFYNKSRGSSEYSYSGNQYSNFSRSVFTRELTIYLMQTAAYYKSVGSIMSRNWQTADGDTESVSSVFDFDFDIYMTAEVCYVKINKFAITGDSMSDFEDADLDSFALMTGKWVDMGEYAELLLEINAANYASLGSINNYFEKNKFSNFTQSNGVYTIKENHLNEFFSFVFGVDFPSDGRGVFKINLSNKIRPSIFLSSSYELDQSTNSGYNIKATAYSENNIAFSNINNTVVRFNADRVYEIADFVDEEDLI